MGIPVMILGNSGTGKSASMRNLDPATYGLINVAGKPLPFKTDKRSFNSDDYGRVTNMLKKASSDIIVIDDAQYMMANAYMRSAMMKLTKDGVFDFYKTIAYDFWNLVQTVNSLPAQKVVYFLGHTEIDQFGNTKFKTIGKLLDDKITVEGLFTIVLRTAIVEGKYYFSTLNDGSDTVKSPIGLFSDRLIENDLAAVDAAIRDYYGFPAPFNANQAPAAQAAPAATQPARAPAPAKGKEKAYANSLV